jgi:hypothetical protein
MSWTHYKEALIFELFSPKKIGDLDSEVLFLRQKCIITLVFKTYAIFSVENITQNRRKQLKIAENS